MMDKNHVYPCMMIDNLKKKKKKKKTKLIDCLLL